MRTGSLALTCILGMELAGAVLILLVPSLFSPGGGNVAIMVVLACLVLTCAVGARYWRPARRASGGHD
ncbi:MAG: hypothetical protein ABIS84_07985 [Arachnia sp.]